jgi:DDE superfamily endonuclease
MLSSTQQIVWPVGWNPQNDPHLPNAYFAMSVDGIHCQIEEPRHETRPKNEKYYSHKFQSAGLCYEIGISVYENRVVHLNGPFRAGQQDKYIMRDHGLLEKLPNDIRVIADKGYDRLAAIKDVVTLAHRTDTKAVQNLKSRARARHESFNSRLKCFSSIHDRFRHKEKKHKIVFEAVIVICCYQLENGKPLFSV